MSKLEALARELCRIRYPNEKRPGECVYVWEAMSEDHQEMFLDSAKCAIQFAIKELQSIPTDGDGLHHNLCIMEKINELRQISA